MIRKKLLGWGMTLLLAVFLCIGTACSGEIETEIPETSEETSSESDSSTLDVTEPDPLDDDMMEEIETAYLTYCQENIEGVYEVSIKVYAGTYSGNIVVMAHWKSNEVDTTTEVVECCVGDIFICWCNDSSYEVIVYTAENEIKELASAYNDGDVSEDELYTIQAVFALLGYGDL